MPTYRVTHPITGQVLKMTGDSAPEDADIEQAFNDTNNWKSRSSSMISSRPNMREKLMEELALEKNPTPERMSLGGRAKFLGKTALLGMGAVGQGIEGAVAAPLLSAQRGEFNPAILGKAAVMGATGAYPAELGDVTNELGMPEWGNKAAGLLGSAALPGPAQLAKGAGAVRNAGLGLVGKGAGATSKGLSKAAAAIGRLEPGAVGYGEKTGWKFMDAGVKPESAMTDLMEAEQRMSSMVGQLRKKATTDFGDAIAPYNTHSFDLFNASGVETGTSTAQRLIDEGLAAVNKKGKLIATTEAGDIGPIVDAINKVRGKKNMSGRDLRKLLFELRDLKSGRTQGTPFITDLEQDIRSTLGQVDELSKASKDYASRIKVLEGDDALGLPGAEQVTDISSRGQSPMMDKILTQSPSAARQRAALEAAEAMMPGSSGVVEELYNKAARHAFSSFAPKTQFSLAGAGTLVGAALWSHNPGMLAGSLLAATQISPKGYALTHKALMSARKRAVELMKTPMVSGATDLLERGIIDPALARQLTGRNDKQ